MNIAYISIGTNLIKSDQIISFFLDVLNTLQQNCGIIKQKSNIYKTEPWGMENSHAFYNNVVLLLTNLNPYQLLEKLQFVEVNLQKHKTNSKLFVNRYVDLDILFYNSLVTVSSELTIPHPLMHLRNFCILPMKELNPSFKHPVFSKTIHELSEILQPQYYEVINFE